MNIGVGELVPGDLCSSALSCGEASHLVKTAGSGSLTLRTGDSSTGYPPCHDHCAGDGGCPALPAHAAAGQDTGGACSALAAHVGDQPKVRLLANVQRTGVLV